MWKLKVRPLFAAKAITGRALTVNVPLMNYIGYLSTVYFVLAARGNNKMVTVWNSFTIPSCQVVLMILGLVWLAVLVW